MEKNFRSIKKQVDLSRRDVRESYVKGVKTGEEKYDRQDEE